METNKMPMRVFLEITMRKFTVLGAIVIAAMFALSAPQPAGAFISNQNGVATAAHATTNTIEVKRYPARFASWQEKGLAWRIKAARPKVTDNSSQVTICSPTTYCNSKPSPN
jgi:hypothetical protein